jgi:hypothetical protein
MRFRIVEKKNHDAVHGHFGSKERAEWFLEHTVPVYIAKGYYSDKSLTAKDFEVIEAEFKPSPKPDLDFVY